MKHAEEVLLSVLVVFRRRVHKPQVAEKEAQVPVALEGFQAGAPHLPALLAGGLDELPYARVEGVLHPGGGLEGGDLFAPEDARLRQPRHVPEALQQRRHVRVHRLGPSALRASQRLQQLQVAELVADGPQLQQQEVEEAHLPAQRRSQLQQLGDASGAGIVRRGRSGGVL